MFQVCNRTEDIGFRRCQIYIPLQRQSSNSRERESTNTAGRKGQLDPSCHYLALAARPRPPVLADMFAPAEPEADILTNPDDLGAQVHGEHRDTSVERRLEDKTWDLIVADYFYIISRRTLTKYSKRIPEAFGILFPRRLSVSWRSL